LVEDEFDGLLTPLARPRARFPGLGYPFAGPFAAIFGYRYGCIEIASGYAHLCAHHLFSRRGAIGNYVAITVYYVTIWDLGKLRSSHSE
jgi:hypothetical protein